MKKFQLLTLAGLFILATESLNAQVFNVNVVANGLTVGRYGGNYGPDANPFGIFHSDGTRDVLFFGNNASTLHLRLLDGDLKMGDGTPASTFYNNGSLFLGGAVGNRLTIGGEGNLNFRLGSLVSVSETGGGLATVIGNNIQSSVSANNYMEYITTTGHAGGRAIKLQYDEGISFHTVAGAVSSGTQMTNRERMRIDNEGRVGIGTSTPTHALEVNGTIRSKEIKVEASPWPDYVFTKDYVLPPLETIESYIRRHHHLPEVPSASDVEKGGVKLGEMNAILLKKIEELTLYVIDLKKQNDLAMEEINKLKAAKGH